MPLCWTPSTTSVAPDTHPARGDHEIIVLRVHPQVSINRKPEERPDFIRPRLLEVWNADWKAVSNSHVIDAAQPLENVLAEVRNIVWNRLPGWVPHIEIAGHAGAGKTTLFNELIRGGAFASGRVWPVNHPLRVLKNAVTLWWGFFSNPIAEWKWMAMAETKLDLWERRIESRNSPIPVVYDQGPFFTNAYALWVHSVRPQSRFYRTWHQHQINRSRQIIDLLIWLEADTALLRQRISFRPQAHAMKQESDEVQHRFLSDLGQYCDYVICDRSGNKVFSSIRVRTDDIKASELADKIVETIY